MTAATADVPFERKSIIPIDPRTKIFLTVTVSTIMCTGGTSGVMVLVRPVLMAVPMVFLLLQKKWKNVIRFSCTYAVLFAAELFLMPMLSGAWSFIFGAAIGIYTHMLPGFIMGYYLIESTTVSEFVAAMERMHISQKIVIPMSVVFRLFPTIGEEYAAIRDAMRLRGITDFREPVKMIEYRVVPLMMSIANIGEELSAAALTKGLGGPEKRTNICSIGFGSLDALMFLAALGCWVGYAV
jgi:energy-coupling factor transport system permease protein